MGFVLLLVLVVGVVVLYRFRVLVLSRILGQPQSRIERRLGQRRGH
jgi:hypothetical protein